MGLEAIQHITSESVFEDFPLSTPAPLQSTAPPNLSEEQFQLNLRNGFPWEKRYSSKFEVEIDGKKQSGLFVVTYLENNDNVEYVRVQVKFKGQPLIRTDSRECDDYCTEKYSIEFPLPPDNPYAIYDKTPGIGCFKLVNSKDQVVSHVIFERDGRVITHDMKLIGSFSA